MGWRLRKSIRLVEGVRFNLGERKKAGAKSKQAEEVPGAGKVVTRLGKLFLFGGSSVAAAALHKMIETPDPLSTPPEAYVLGS